MKAHTSSYKDNVRLFGRELDSIITYTLNGEQIELGTNDLNSVTPHYEGAILKSVMRQLDIDSNVEIPVGTILNYQFGVKINGTYEYINFGDYVVNTVEKQEDVDSYKIVCYDKMLYSMVDYESTGITYPATVRDYIGAVATKIGLTFKNANDTFANYNRIIDHELYLDTDGNSLGYTFRDVLDELAQVTASTICINQEDGELEIRYINDTGDTINEEYLKDVNVNFGEKYGPVNSIVLSRASEADNVYLQDEESVAENGLCEIKIKENQIMNFNDRSDYLPDILGVLGGLEYYLNDFSSTGITYLNLCDRYNVQIGENTYSCIMFNDEINITQGLEEIIFTELPEESETDYKKADKTDRKINQTYIIVDKQNQTITSLANEVGQYDSRITTVEQDVNTIKQTAISYEDLKRSAKSVNMLHIENAVPNYPLKFSIKNASVLFPQINLYPGSDTIPEYKHLVLVVDKTRNLSDEARIVELPVKKLFAQDDVYDEFVVEGKKAYIIHRLIANQQGQIVPLQEEFIEDLPNVEIPMFEGDNYIYLYSLINDGAIYEITYTIPSEFTNVFATEVYVDSTIEQTANQILLQVNEKVDEDEIIAKLNVAVEEGKGIVNLVGNTVTIESDNFTLDADGRIDATSGEVGGFNLSETTLDSPIYPIRKIYREGEYIEEEFEIYSTEFIEAIRQILLSGRTPTQEEIEMYDLNGDGQITSQDYALARTTQVYNIDKDHPGRVSLNTKSVNNVLTIYDKDDNERVNLSMTTLDFYSQLTGEYSSLGAGGMTCHDIDDNGYTLSPQYFMLSNSDSSNFIVINAGTPMISVRANNTETYIDNTQVQSQNFVNNSLEKDKKNFKKFENALDIIKKADVYSYNWKNDDDSDKKQYGLVIGKKYNTPKEFLSKDGKGINTYSMISICLQAIKEQQEEIDELKKLIKESDK